MRAVTAFLVNFGMAYWIGAAIALLPWYAPPDLDAIFAGFRQSTFALVGFAVGVLVLAPRPAKASEVRTADQTNGLERLPPIYVGSDWCVSWCYCRGQSHSERQRPGLTGLEPGRRRAGVGLLVCLERYALEVRVV